MRKKIKNIIWVYILCVISPLLYAQTKGDYLDKPQEEISFIVGEVNIFNVSDLKRVAIRNPEIADIKKIEANQVVVMAISPGETVLNIWDKNGERKYYITVYPRDLDRLKEKLEDTIYKKLGISGVYMKKNELTGKLLIMGEVTPQEKTQIDIILAPFFKQVTTTGGQTQVYSDVIENLLVEKEENMVEIECEIMELTRNWAEVLGFDWTGTAGTSPVQTLTVTESIANKAAGLGGTPKEVFRIVDWTRSALDVKLNAALSEGKGKILAKPKLLVLSNKEASFLVGGEIPVVTTSTTSSTIQENVEYKEYGISLKILPVVIGDNVKLDITAEVKELSSEGQYTRSDGTTIKAFTTRTVTSSLILNPNQGVFISGLLKDKVTKDDLHRVPGLSDIPILGNLFRSKDYQADQTELIISLTPRVVNINKKFENNNTISANENYYEKVKPVVYPEYVPQVNVLNDYISRVQERIYNSLMYPEIAKKAGWQGIVKLRLHIGHNGKLIDAFIVESSGYVSFDKAALETVKSIGLYPPFPPSIEQEDIWIDIPIVYRID